MAKTFLLDKRIFVFGLPSIFIFFAGFFFGLPSILFLCCLGFFIFFAWLKPLAAFYLLAAYLPFQAACNLTAGIDLMSGRILTLILFAFAAGRHFAGGGSWRVFLPDRVGLALVVFFGLSAISFIIAEEKIWAARKILFLLSWLPLYFLTVYFINDEKKIKRFISLALVTAGVSACIGLSQFFAQFVINRDALINFWLTRLAPVFSGASFARLIQTNHSWLVSSGGVDFFRAVGLFPDPHALAFYLGMALFSGLAVFFFGRRYKKLTGAACLLILAVIALTFSRGGYVGVAAAFVFFLIAGKNCLSPKDKKFLFSAWFILAAFVCLFSPVADRWQSIFSLTDGSNLGRLGIWRESLQIISGSPILGVGLGNYSLAVDFAQDYRNAMTSHNLYLDLWAELGILGLLSWLFLVGTALCLAWRGRERYPLPFLGASAALVYFSAHAFFETAIFNPTVLAFFFIHLGLISALNKQNVCRD